MVSAQDDLYRTDKNEKVVQADGATSLPLTPGGAYEKQTVVAVEGASAAILFERAMIALSDWTGPDGKAQAGIDYQNAETHTVIYKGRFSLGFKNTFLGDGWYRFAEFTLKVRCKDGRAQVTATVPTMTAVYNRNGMTRQMSIKELLEAVEKSKGDRRVRGTKLISDMREITDLIVTLMTNRLSEDIDDDF